MTPDGEPRDPSVQLASIPAVLEDLKAGKMIVLVDDEDRENEGDLVMFAEKITAEGVNFMARFGRGLICLPMDKEIADRLELPPQVERNESPMGTAFTVSIEARTGVTTGISAADRARTIQVAADPQSTARDLVRPGHIFPLRAHNGGVLRRAGQTEGAVDLAKLAGCRPIAVICEIMNDDGTMARMPDLVEFAREHDLKIVTIKDLIQHRLRNEQLVHRAAESRMPTRAGPRVQSAARAPSPHPRGCRPARGRTRHRCCCGCGG